MNRAYKLLITALIMIFCTPASAAIFDSEDAGIMLVFGRTYAFSVNWNAISLSLHANVYAFSVDIMAGRFVSDSMIWARNVNIVAASINGPKDPDLGLICWSNSFTLNGQRQTYHDPKCD